MYVWFIGTRACREPELLLGVRRYTCSVDVWSAGCVFAEKMSVKTLCNKLRWLSRRTLPRCLARAPTASDFGSIHRNDKAKAWLRRLDLSEIPRQHSPSDFLITSTLAHWTCRAPASFSSAFLLLRGWIQERCFVPLFLVELRFAEILLPNDPPRLYDKSANDTSAKPTVRMPTVRKGQQCEWDKSANAKCANASSAMRHRCEKLEVRQVCEWQQCEKDTVPWHACACTAFPTRAWVLGSSKPLFSPNKPFPNQAITWLKYPFALTQIQGLKRFEELFGSTFTYLFFDDLLGSVSLPLP